MAGQWQKVAGTKDCTNAVILQNCRHNAWERDGPMMGY